MSKNISLVLIAAQVLILGLIQPLQAQHDSPKDSLQRLQRYIADTTYIDEVEDKSGKIDKVLHAEPLYIDLIRDLGARKGESEWNVAYGMTDVKSFTRYEALIEYEFAPVNRLGFEVELPVSIYQNNPSDSTFSVPSDRINGLKLASQFSFYVSEKHKLSLAIGYIHEFEITDVDKFGKERFYKGNIFNPFFVVAKRWGNNFHTLLYTGPKCIKEFNKPAQFEYSINTSFHYMVSGTRNFIGIEVNKNFTQSGFSTVLRPQMRLEIAPRLMIGIVAGVPIRLSQERFSTFLRLIYEPKHKKT